MTLASTNGVSWMGSDLLLDANQAFRYRLGGGSSAQEPVADVISYRFEA